MATYRSVHGGRRSQAQVSRHALPEALPHQRPLQLIEALAIYQGCMRCLVLWLV